MEKKFIIKEIMDIKFIDIETGKEIKDIRDETPIKQTFDPNKPIIELVKSVSPSYSICNHPLIRKYGYDTFGSVCEKWYWKDSLNEASELELWQIYAIIQSTDKYDYQYYYDKEVYEFRKYKNETKNLNNKYNNLVKQVQKDECYDCEYKVNIKEDNKS